MRLILNQELPRSIAFGAYSEKNIPNCAYCHWLAVYIRILHNHLYYFDPSQGRIEPIISDVNGHGLLLYPSPRERFVLEYKPFVEVPLNGRNNPLLDIALRDPSFRHLRNKFLYEYLIKDGSFETQSKELQKIFNDIDPSVRRDRNKASIIETFVGFWRIPYSNANMKNLKLCFLIGFKTKRVSYAGACIF